MVPKHFHFFFSSFLVHKWAIQFKIERTFHLRRTMNTIQRRPSATSHSFKVQFFFLNKMYNSHWVLYFNETTTLTITLLYSIKCSVCCPLIDIVEDRTIWITIKYKIIFDMFLVSKCNLYNGMKIIRLLFLFSRSFHIHNNTHNTYKSTHSGTSFQWHKLILIHFNYAISSDHSICLIKKKAVLISFHREK